LRINVDDGEMSMIKKNAVWFITGCSKGLGRALAENVLTSGYRAVITARRAEDIADLVKQYPKTGFLVVLDVTRKDQIEIAIAKAEEQFGSIDVLVNNAGYGYLGAIEEGDDADVRKMFDTNVFAPVDLIKAVLPGMRQRGEGHIVNISSVGGFVTYPSVGYYHMAKFAIEGLTETLAKEVTPFGIGVTAVEPGPFRTDFRGGSMKQAKLRLPAYAETAGKARDAVLAGDGKQSGDPDRGARAIVAAVEAEHPPLHLVMGTGALKEFRQKIIDLQQEWDGWEKVTRGTDFPEAAA
jgi:NAD(P)-dependent dehydrogenase (short-subunit alcohol dehydrogenase family)